MAQPFRVGPDSPTPVPPPLAAAPLPPRSWRGLALRARERFFVQLAVASAAVAMAWSLVSLGYSVMLRGASTLPSESTLHLWTWQYHLSESTVLSSAEWMSPPLLVVGLLVAGYLVIQGVAQGQANQANRVRRAQGKLVAFRWSGRAARARVRAELRAAGYRGLCGTAGRVRLVIGSVLVALAGLWSFFLPLQDGFTRGVGPVVVGVAALVTVVSMLAATPWAHWPAVTMFGDGTLVVDGREPLAEVVTFPTPAPTPAPAPPPPVTAVPKVSGEPYPPPPPRAAAPPPPPHRWEPF